MASNNTRFLYGKMINNCKLFDKRSNFYVNAAKFIHKDSLLKYTLNNLTQFLRHDSKQANSGDLGEDVTTDVPLDKQNRAETPQARKIERDPVIEDAPKADEMNILVTGEAHSDYVSREKETKRNLDMKMNEGDIFEFHTGKVSIDDMVEEGQQTAKDIEKCTKKIKVKIDKTTYTSK